MTAIKKKDFVEIKYSGYSNGQLFDSNIEEDLKKIDSKAEPQKTIIVVGEGMLVPGFDKALEGKELNKEYSVDVKFKEGFGDRRRDLIKTIPLKSFHAQRVDPKPGMVLALDNSIAKIVAVSGARVITDFNNPMAGKDLTYKFSIIRKVDDEQEKVKVLLEFFFKFAPEFEIKENEILVKGPQLLEAYIKVFGGKVKEILGKELKFELKLPTKEEKKDDDPENKVETNQTNT